MIVPIVAITASVGEDLGLTCEAAGIDQCLTKPVLLSTLKELLGAISKDSITPMPSWGPAGPLVGLYLRNDLLALSAAMQRHDAVGFGRGLHAMAGALATLEHAAEWQACRWLEKAVQQRGLDGIHAEWLALQASIQQLIADYGDLVASESAWCGQGESCT